MEELLKKNVFFWKIFKQNFGGFSEKKCLVNLFLKNFSRNFQKLSLRNFKKSTAGNSYFSAILERIPGGVFECINGENRSGSIMTAQACFFLERTTSEDNIQQRTRMEQAPPWRGWRWLCTSWLFAIEEGLMTPNSTQRPEGLKAIGTGLGQELGSTKRNYIAQ